MKRKWLASTIFNLAFFCVTAVTCVVYLLILPFPRAWLIRGIRVWVHSITFLEKHILGLNYEVRGLENLPETGPYLVAAKHQSTYETFKLHLLFDDPAIILKKELLRIPLWGMYLRKSDVIAIDRTTPERALKSIERGVHHVKEQGRPLVIFPQGTRVSPEATTAEKPYKPGIARIQSLTDLPIIPLALNTGLFCPRKSWLKSGGTVIFEFLEPINPGKDKRHLMSEIEEKLERESARLVNEAQINAAEKPEKRLNPVLVTFLMLFIALCAYRIWWFNIAETVQSAYINQIQKIAQIDHAGIPMLSGFPGKIKMEVLQQAVQSDSLFIKAQIIQAQSWPLLFLPIETVTGPVTVQHFKWPNPLTFESTSAKVTYINDVLTILESAVKYEDFKGEVTGTIDFTNKDQPVFNLNVALENHQILLQHLTDLYIIKPRIALFMNAGLTVLADPDGIVRVPLTQIGRTLYAGPLPVAILPGQDRRAP